jgi:hypothetical protein
VLAHPTWPITGFIVNLRIEQFPYIDKAIT